MPIIVATSPDGSTFKFINDGRPQQGNENYTYYASKEQAPDDIKAVMDKPLDPNRDYREQAAVAKPAAAPAAALAASNVAPRAGAPAVPNASAQAPAFYGRAPATPRQGAGQMIGGAQGSYDPATGTIKPTSSANIAPRAGAPTVPGSLGAAPPAPAFYGRAPATPAAAPAAQAASPGPVPFRGPQGATPEPAPADLWRRMGYGTPERPVYDQSYVAPSPPLGQYTRPPGYDTASAGSLYSPPSGPPEYPGMQFDTPRLTPPREGESIPSWMMPPPGQMGPAGGGGISGFGTDLGIQNIQIPTGAEGAAPPMIQMLQPGEQPAFYGRGTQTLQGLQPYGRRGY